MPTNSCRKEMLWKHVMSISTVKRQIAKCLVDKSTKIVGKKTLSAAKPVSEWCEKCSANLHMKRYVLKLVASTAESRTRAKRNAS